MSDRMGGDPYLNPCLLLCVTFVRLGFIVFASVLLTFTDALHVAFIVIAPAEGPISSLVALNDSMLLTVCDFPHWQLQTA